MRSVDGAYGFEPEVSYVLAGNTAVGEALANVGEHVELASLVSKVREHAISTLGGPA
jgi:hypothetical protein